MTLQAEASESFSDWLATEPVAQSATDPSLIASSFKMLGALAFVLALLIFGLWLLRRFGAQWAGGTKGADHGPQVLHQRPLGGRRMLTVVKWEGRRLLLGVTGDSISLLASEPEGLTPGDEAAFEGELSEVFHDRERPLERLPRELPEERILQGVGERF
ncbi:flagellar biosynthetic protein FliO [Candidatus Sumerlaeota bacterium]|nr:flagellar biosynthetic protein FliO [Candidatus Sumerlaeota bacterium]